jgi:hypothetical protein
MKKLMGPLKIEKDKTPLIGLIVLIKKEMYFYSRPKVSIHKIYIKIYLDNVFKNT